MSQVFTKSIVEVGALCDTLPPNLYSEGIHTKGVDKILEANL